MTSSRALRQRDERGIYVILTAIVLVVMLGLAALVLDLAELRQDRAANRSAADFASTSAALTLSNSGGSGMQQACNDAWAYLVANLEDAGSGSIGCGTFAGTCTDGMAARTASASTGPYSVTITHPVPDSMLAPDTIADTGTQGVDTAIDGRPCERVRVAVTQSRQPFFAGIFGIGSTSTTSFSTARALTGTTEGETVALLILEPSECNALTARGNGFIEVKENGEKPGIIVVDSSGNGPTCESRGPNPSKFTTDADGTNPRIRALQGTGGAPGIVRLYALAPGQRSAAAYDTEDVALGRLSPQPTALPGQVTRSPVDWRYNCTLAGFDLSVGTADDCPDAATRTAYIDRLRSQLGSDGLPSGLGYVRYTDLGGECDSKGDDPAPFEGNIWVDCSAFVVSNEVTFQRGNVVFQGSVQVKSDGVLRLNATSESDSIAYVRSGPLARDAKAHLSMPRTFVYLHDGPTTVVGGGSSSGGSVYWSAPQAGDFEDLALWSESVDTHDIAGQGAIDLDGVFFTPNATVSFTGQAEHEQVNAQFIARSLDVWGNGILKMQPDPDRVVPIPLRGVRLIR